MDRFAERAKELAAELMRDALDARMHRIDVWAQQVADNAL